MELWHWIFIKLTQTGGLTSFVVFLLLLVFGNAIIEQGKVSEKDKKISNKVMGWSCVIFLGGLGLAFIGGIGMIWTTP